MINMDKIQDFSFFVVVFPAINEPPFINISDFAMFYISWLAIDMR